MTRHYSDSAFVRGRDGPVRFAGPSGGRWRAGSGQDCGGLWFGDARPCRADNECHAGDQAPEYDQPGGEEQQAGKLDSGEGEAGLITPGTRPGKPA